MSEEGKKSGLFVSGALHAALLGMLVFGFARAPKFEDATESIPVETLTNAQANEIMNGEKTAKPAKVPTPPAKMANVEPPPAPTPPLPPTPPEPPPDLRKAEETPPPPPPKPAPPPPAPKPAPPPPPKPVADDAPEPPVKPKIVEKPPEKPPERPRDLEKPKPDKPKTDDVAKLLAKEKADEAVKEAAKEAAKEKAKEAAKEKATKVAEKSKLDAEIAKFLNQSKSADATPTGTTAQGLPTQHAQRMSPSLSAALDAWFTESYLGCWTPPPTTPEGERYVADVRVVFNPDGSLSAQPVLGNPPRDPAWRAHAESAVRAVLKCNPLHVPPQYAPYFEQWKSKTIHFDPQSALG